MIIAFIFAFLTGAFSVLLLQAFLLYKWWSAKEREPPKLVVQHEKASNPKLIADYIKNEGPSETESCAFLNLFLTFLWGEWQHSEGAKNFCLKRLNMEFSDLVHSKTAGRVIEQITIRELTLGNSLPVIKGATVMKVGCKTPEEVPHELDISLDLEYTGGCHVAIQVDLLFNKSANFSVKLAYLKGRGRLQFQRHPCTHWSFAFYEEPELEFEAESQFEGKSIPQLTSLIVNHLRRSMYKKHTLPNYKIRYNPFFKEKKPQDEQQSVYIHDNMITIGTLAVEVVGCSKLPEVEGSISLYCSLSVDVLPWKQLAENSRALWTNFEVDISRGASTSSFGMNLSKEYSSTEFDKFIMVDMITPKSPADMAGLRKGDVLVTVDGQKIETLKQAAKLIKNKVKFSATFQRPPSKMSHDRLDGTTVNFENVNPDSGESDSEEAFVNIVMPLIKESSEGEAAKTAVQEKTTELRQRAGKAASKTTQNTASTQPLKKSATLSGDSRKAAKESAQTIRSHRAASLSADGRAESIKSNDKSRSVSPEPQGSASKSEPNGLPPRDDNAQKSLVLKPSTYSERPGTKKTREVPSCPDPSWNETASFDVEKKDKYLNLCVWSKSQEKTEKDILMGYITVPLMDVIVQCMMVGVGRHDQTFILVSPHIDRIIASRPHLRAHQGLKEELCGGDVTLIFHHKPLLTQCEDSVTEKQEELGRISQEIDPEPEDVGSESLEQMEHHFVLTQFYFPTRCNYCSKKVWTKVAFQCRNCALICHKKCLENCKRFSSCLRSTRAKSNWFTKRSSRPPDEAVAKPELPLPEVTSPEDTSLEPSEVLLKTNDDRPPLPTAELSGVLPDMPSEKSTDNGQVTDEESAVQNAEGSASPEMDTESHVTTHRHQSDRSDDEYQLASTEPAEPLDMEPARPSDMETASLQVREMGRELFSNLTQDKRKTKLQEMMVKLQVEIDEENETQTELYKTKKQTKDKKQRNFLAFQIAKSEERSQALAMLMLQYCAGLQSCADAEEEETCQL